MIQCGNCGERFEPARTRWLCPHCGHKESCCEGEPQRLDTYIENPDPREHGYHLHLSFMPEAAERTRRDTE